MIFFIVVFIVIFDLLILSLCKASSIDELYYNGEQISVVRTIPILTIRGILFKRITDLITSIAAIIIFSPAMLIISIIIKLTSPGEILFKQERVGQNNKIFTMYKFRTMVVQDKEDEKNKWTTNGDNRITKFGSFLRKTSLDEIPQFFNILKGDMSLIGARPERPYWVNKFNKKIPNYNYRHTAKVGLTGWAQVNGLRGDTSIKKRVEHDIYYIENWSCRLDVKIIFLTFFKGFFNKNAY